MRALTIATWLALAVLFCAPELQAEPFDRLLPDTTILYVSIENIARTKERFKESALQGLWDDPAVGNRSAPVVMDMETLALENTIGDTNGDGEVGIDDFLFVLGNWGPCPPGPCLADFDCDGVVGINDFLILLGLWGT